MSQNEKERRITCVVCPVGCEITVRGEAGKILSLEGNQCNRGDQYARTEFTSPVRILTSTVKLEGAKEPLLPVRSTQPLPKNLLFDCMDEIRRVKVQAPVSRYDVLIRNIQNTGVDIVATADARPLF